MKKNFKNIMLAGFQRLFCFLFLFLMSFSQTEAATAIATASAIAPIPTRTFTPYYTHIPSPTSFPTNSFTPTPGEGEVWRGKRVQNLTDGGAYTYSDPAEPGDQLRYTLWVENHTGYTLSSYVMQDYIDEILEYADFLYATGGGFLFDYSYVRWPAQDILPGDRYERSFYVEVRNHLNPGLFSMTNVFGQEVEVFVRGENYSPTFTPIYSNTYTPFSPSATSSVGSFTSTPYYFTQTNTPIDLTTTPSFTPIYTRTDTPFYPTRTFTPAHYQIGKEKKVSNITDPEAVTRADPAESGDYLRYELRVTNYSAYPVYNYQVEDDIGDLLKYAHFISAEEGGYLLSNNKVVWNNIYLSPQQTRSFFFQMKVKNPLPDLDNDDYIMTNFFGNYVDVYLDKDIDRALIRLKKYVRKSGSDWMNYNEDGEILTVEEGEKIYYQIRVWNEGDADSDELFLDDDLECPYCYEYVENWDDEIGEIDYRYHDSESDAKIREFETQLKDEYFSSITYLDNVVEIDNLDLSSSTRIKVYPENYQETATNTPRHTNTPRDTNTPRHTNTPRPTKTPTPQLPVSGLWGNGSVTYGLGSFVMILALSFLGSFYLYNKKKTKIENLTLK